MEAPPLRGSRRMWCDISTLECVAPAVPGNERRHSAVEWEGGRGHQLLLCSARVRQSAAGRQAECGGVAAMRAGSLAEAT